MLWVINKIYNLQAIQQVLGRTMTQIFTGEGLGLQGSSLGLGSYGPKGIAALGQGGESVFVNAANGNLVLRQSDGFLADIGFGLDLFQTYNSRGDSSCWRFNVASCLEFSGTTNTEDSRIIRIAEDGHRTSFHFDVTKQMYLSDEGGTARITWNTNGWSYKEGNQKTAFHYNQGGQLTKIADLDGHHFNLSYTDGQLSSVVDSSSKQKVTWSFENGLLQDVKTISDGTLIHHLHYEYNASGQLHKVSRDLGDGKIYWITYDYIPDSNLISDVRQSDGTALHIEYDAQGRVKRFVDGEGRLSIYEYSQGTTTVTNSLGESWSYYYDGQNRLTGIDGPEHYRIRYYYEGKQLSAIIQGNQVWKFTYNTEGDCIQLEEPTGHMTQRIYDSNHQVLAETHYQVFDGNHHLQKPLTTRYIYDERGHLLFTIAADGTVTERRYDEQGQLLSTRCYLRATYDVAILTHDTLLNQQELQFWVNQQNPQDISLIDYSYDWRGQLTEETHYGQVDAAGLGIINGALRTRCRYDAAGRLVEKSIPTDKGWSITQYLYDDLGRLLQTLDNQQHSQRIEYDDAHQRIIQTDANGLQTVRLYDHSGLLLSVTKLETNHTYGSIQYQYDAAGRLIAETGMDGLTRYCFYDQQGRLHAQVTATGQVTEYRYNEEGLLLQTHQYEQRISMVGLDKFPLFTQIKPQYSTHDRIAQNIYDSSGQLAYRINSEGAVIAYQYNAEGQVVSTTAYANTLDHYDSKQVLTINEIQLLTTDQDRTLLYYYDALGRIQAEINGEGFATAYRYDRLGNIIDTCRYFNTSILKSGNWLHDQPQKDDWRDIHQYSLFDIRGLKVADIDGEGYLTEYQYDDNGLLTKRCAYEQALKKPLDINETTILDKIRPEAQHNDHYTAYQYNDLGLLIKETTQNGLLTLYTYDEMGHVITKTLTDEKTQIAREQRYRYDALGRVIQSLDELGSVLLNQADLSQSDMELIWLQHGIHYQYNKAGLLSTKTNALNQTTYYFYDESTQPRFIINSDGAVSETQYNSFNQVESVKKYSTYLSINPAGLTTKEIQQHLSLVQNEHFDEVTRYEYNTIGQVIAKYTGSKGVVTSDYNAFGELAHTRQNIDSQEKRVTGFYYDRRGLLVRTRDDVDGMSKNTSIEYDAFGWVAERIDAQSNKIRYRLNQRGEQILIAKANGGMNSIEYDGFGRMLHETNYGNFETKSYVYDDINNTFTVTDLLIGREVSTQFNAFGDKVSVTDGTGLTTDYRFDEKGQLIRVDSPEQTFKEYQYDRLGRLSFQTDASGQIIQYHYDAEGHILSKIIDPGGVNLTSSYQYDAIGRQLQVNEANGCTKQFIYDDEGHLIESCVDPEGLNLRTLFSYDHRGLLLRQTEMNPQGNNKITAYQWDALGRKVATIIDPEGLALTTTYQYDANDNIICTTDANQHSIHFVYDVENQCRYQINAQGVVSEFKYDINGHKTQAITYAKTVEYLSEYNEALLKSIISKDPLHDQYQFYKFDSVGRMTLSYDALGYATSYTYDNNDNLVYTCSYASAVSLEKLKNGAMILPSKEGSRNHYFVYDGLNQLRFKCDNNGAVVESRYNLSGELISTTQYVEKINLGASKYFTVEYIEQNLRPNLLKDQTSHYAYNKAGQLIKELSAQGIAKSYQYDEVGNLIASTLYATPFTMDQGFSFETMRLATSSKDRTNHFLYDAAGREQYRISSEGRVLERRYDAVGNVIQELTHATLAQLSTYSLETVRKALHLRDNDAKITQYDYDASGRLLSEINNQKNAIQYSYDAEGNVLTKTAANHAIWTYRYDETNQLIETIAPATLITTASGQVTRAVITRNRYDSFGNLISVTRDVDGLNQKLVYEYDNKNQKIKTIYPNVAVNNSSSHASNQRQEIQQDLIEESKYNAFGQTVASCDKAGNWKHSAFDQLGTLIYSLDAEGGLTQYHYDSFGRVSSKTTYANAISMDQNSDYSINSIHELQRVSIYDRHEYYVYDRDNQLIETTKDPVRTYNPKTGHYDITLKPTTKTTYNAFGEVVKTSIKLNESEWANTFIYYDHDGHKSACIDAEGYLTTYTQNAFGDLEATTEYAQVTNDWDVNSYGMPQSNIKDRRVTFTYDSLGQLISKTLKEVPVARKKPDGSYETIAKDLTTYYGYDAAGHLTQTTDAQGNTSNCYYNEAGLLIAKVAPKTQEGRATTTYSYDSLGHLVETRRWANGALEADAAHFLLQGASASDVITQQEYDLQGHVIAETDSLRHMIYYSYDANGNLARSWRPLKQADNSILIQDKRYSYDKENRLLQTATFKNADTLKTEEAQYNAFGEVIAKGVGGHYNVHVEYDALGRVWRSNTEGYYQIYVYDLMNHVTQIVTSTSHYRPEYLDNGLDLSDAIFEKAVSYDQDVWQLDLQRQNNQYDRLGNLLAQTKEFTTTSKGSNDAHMEQMKQTQSVDRWGNMLCFTNARGFQTHYEYNAFNQLIRQELPEVAVMDEHGTSRILKPVTSYAYDELGQAIAMIDANGHVVSKEYDALGRITKEVDAKGQSRIKHYNLLDQLSSVTNELGSVTTYTYDQMNRLLAVRTPKTQQQYEYDESGQLIKQKNGANEEATFWYDTLGNQIKRVDARGYETRYEYDDFGHKTKEIDALGNTQSWLYNEEGLLQQHTDLGGHTTTYKYNTNGLMIEEQSTAGKHIKYHYQGTGELIQYVDEARDEVVNYAYDSEGHVINKESSRGGDNKGWSREIDYYQYDALGRLVQVRRRNPDDTDTRFPDKDHALLSIDYEYDAVSNIRHTQVKANYTGYEQVQNEDYYLYDENNRMTVNKGQLINGQIVMTQAQGSTLSYDASGTIKDASTYEHGAIQNYHYQYNSDNQLELTQKNGRTIQAKAYDAAGHVIEEHLFDTNGNVSQANIMMYEHGLLVAQSTKNKSNTEISKTTYSYDVAGNMIDLTMRVNSQGTSLGLTLNHHYSYALWDGYQQSVDDASETRDKQATTHGKSTRFYDVNGQLQNALDATADSSGSSNSTNYWNSAVDGIRAREDKEGKTSYLSVSGKTIGDLRLDKVGKQHLTVYGGFTPTGSQQKATSSRFAWRSSAALGTTGGFLGRTRAAGDIADGTLPESSQDNLGAYTLQAGDSLERIALHIYGDSSLWYLLADANGISDRSAHASNSGPLHIGQRLNIPPVATGQHHTSGTHKVINANQLIGNTSATTPLPAAPPPLPKKHFGLFSKIIVGIVAAVATVLTAGVIGAIAGVSEGLGSLFAIGTNVLGGGAMATTTGTLAAGFTAGFIGNLATQGVSKALGMQDGVDLKGALISGLATAATAGMFKGLSTSTNYQKMVDSVNNLNISKTFSITSAAELMEQNAASQGLNVALRKHQHFDWEQLGIAGVTAGIMGGTAGKNLEKTLRKIDFNTGILSSELNSLANAGVQQAATGATFNATQVLSDNLGSAIGSGIIRANSPWENPDEQESFNILDESNLSDAVLDVIHPERTADGVYNNYVAQIHDEPVAYNPFKEIKDKNTDLFENRTYWSYMSHGAKQFVNCPIASTDSMGLSFIKGTEKIKNINYSKLLNSEDFKIYLATIYGEAGNQSSNSWVAIGNVINNRVGYREWSKYKSQTDVIKYSGFDAYTKKSNQYLIAYNIISSKKLNLKLTEMMHIIAPVYLGLTKDTTKGAILYYSPRTQSILASKSKEYKVIPNWNWNEIKKVYPTGVKEDDFAFYKYK
jgi:YD repeat-containing protein